MSEKFDSNDYIFNLDSATFDTNKKYYISRSRTVGKKESMRRLLEYIKNKGNNHE